MRHLLCFFAIGSLLFGGKQLLALREAPVVTVHVAPSASRAEQEQAIDEALLVEEAIRAGGALIDPVVREQLLASMRSSFEAAPDAADDDAALLERALALGVHRADPVARQRLAFQAEQLLGARSASERPSDAALSAYLREHAARYVVPARTSFVQVFLSRTERGDRAERDAEALRDRLAREEPALDDVHTRGDATRLPARLEVATGTEIEARFGPAFTAALHALPEGSWRGPIASPFGLHVVRVSARVPPTPPALASVRARVLADYQHDRRRALMRAQLDALRARYRVEVRPRS